jgi:hypothetical protein
MPARAGGTYAPAKGGARRTPEGFGEEHSPTTGSGPFTGAVPGEWFAATVANRFVPVKFA